MAAWTPITMRTKPAPGSNALAGRLTRVLTIVVLVVRRASASREAVA